MKLPFRSSMMQNTLMACAILTVLACGGNCGGDDEQSYQVVGPLNFTGVYGGAGEDLHIRESSQVETTANRFSAGQTKVVGGTSQVFYSASGAVTVQYVASRPGATLATSNLSITLVQAQAIQVGTSRIRVTYNGTTLSTFIEPVGS